jgi:aminopeptidase
MDIPNMFQKVLFKAHNLNGRASPLQSTSIDREWFEVDVAGACSMARRPPRTGPDKEPPPEVDDDLDLEAVVDAEATDESVAQIVDESTDDAEKMNESAQMVVNTCMDIRRGENVLIVCDPTTGEIGQALHRAASKRSDRILLIVMPKGRHHGEEPPSPVSNLMRQQQIVIAPTKYSLTHTRAIRAAVKEGARVATMPGITDKMFIGGGMTADFSAIKKQISVLSSTLRRKRLLHITCENGTDVEFEISWRDWKMDDHGVCNRPRMITNLPAGKVFVLPKEGTMEGTIIIDGSWESTLLETPLELTVEKGIVIDIKGDSTAAQIRQQFGEAATRLKSKDREMVWTVAEFGFGMNPNARLTGHVLEDEKKLGTCYFSIGDNSSLGGHALVGIHIPGVITKPSVWLDDTQVIDDGKFIAN